MNSIARNLRFFRQKFQMTQAQVAAALGVQYQTVSKWETGVSLPDAMMLPRLADLFGSSVDDLFGRRQTGCTREIPRDTAAFLLQTYAGMYGPEAGPWNLSVENKYLEYRITAFFEEHFPVAEGADLCNIGIGAGEWDRYLSYRLRGGSLTSIDREEICCRQLEQRLLWEGNPNEVNVICADVMTLDFPRQFEIVTMVGSTIEEGNMGLALLEKAMGFVRPGGALYFQTLQERADCDAVIRTAYRQGMALMGHRQDDAYGYHCHFYRFLRPLPRDREQIP